MLSFRKGYLSMDYLKIPGAPSSEWYYILRVQIALFLIGFSYPLEGFHLRYELATTYRYSYLTETIFGDQLNNNQSSDIGITITSQVAITPVWKKENKLVVMLSMVSPQLQSVSRPTLLKYLQALPRLPIYFEWEGGKIGEVFVGDDDTTLSINVKKGIVSLLQLRFEAGRYSEIDTCGECEVEYDVNQDKSVINKRKINCDSFDHAGEFRHTHPLLDLRANLSSRSVYRIENEVISNIESFELFASSFTFLANLTSSLRSRQILKFVDLETSESIDAQSQEELLLKLSKDRNARLFGMSLGTTFEPQHCHGNNCVNTADIVAQNIVHLKAANMVGKKSAALAFKQLVKAFRSSSNDTILKILKSKKKQTVIKPLVEAAVAAQTKSSLDALSSFLTFKEKSDVVERFLLAAALSTHPQDFLVQYLLRLYKTEISSPELKESIALSLGAVIYTFSRLNPEQKLVHEVEENFLSRLSNSTGTTTNKLIASRALANAKLPGTLHGLLSVAENSTESLLSETALKSITCFDPHLITPEIRERIKEIFEERRRPYDSAIRSLALEILLRNSSKEELRDFFLTSFDSLKTEYGVYIRSRITDAAKKDQRIKLLLRDILEETQIYNYNLLAKKGTALAFTSYLPENGDFLYAFQVENGRSGILKRFRMHVNCETELGTLPLSKMEIFASGLEAALGDGTDDQNEEELSVSMAMDMMGVALRPITFFTGQGGLMSALWNLPSEPVTALQVFFLLHDHSERIHLQNGFIAELNVLSSVSVDITGSISVSLWNKNSKTFIKDSGALSIEGALHIVTSSFKIGEKFAVDGELEFDFKTNIDFYDGVKLCVQMIRPAFSYTHHLEKFEGASGFEKSLRIKKSKKTFINGISYPLPPSNSVACKILTKDDEE